MRIHGLQKTTLLDYPEHIAATVFTGGCNFRCPYCHNMELVLHPEAVENITEDVFFDFLKKRTGILDGVCVTGGEPTLQPDLLSFIRKIKELGYLVKLDTNGSRPEVLRKAIESRLVDYVAMDIKAAPTNYGRAIGIENPDISDVLESIRLLKEERVPYEFRTTVVKGIHTVEEFHEIGELLKGARAYYIQCFIESEFVPDKSLCAFSAEELEEICTIAKKYIHNVSLRGV